MELPRFSQNPPTSCANLHIGAFLRRFVRYGRGNRLLSIRYKVDLAPRPFPPQCPSFINWVLAGLQYLSLWWGYAVTTAPRAWSVPSEEVSWVDERTSPLIWHHTRRPVATD